VPSQELAHRPFAAVERGDAAVPTPTPLFASTSSNATPRVRVSQSDAPRWSVHELLLEQHEHEHRGFGREFSASTFANIQQVSTLPCGESRIVHRCIADE
jgi:hypothetical protein